MDLLKAAKRIGGYAHRKLWRIFHFFAVDSPLVPAFIELQNRGECNDETWLVRGESRG